MGLNEIILVGHKTVFRAMAHEVDTVLEASDLREIYQVLEEVEADLTKVLMLADLESQAGQFQEMLQNYCKKPGHISRFCER